MSFMFSLHQTTSLHLVEGASRQEEGMRSYKHIVTGPNKCRHYFDTTCGCVHCAGSPYRPRRWLPLSAAGSPYRPLAPPIGRAAGSPYPPRRWLPLSAAGSPYPPRRWLPLSAAGSPYRPRRWLPLSDAAGSPYRPRRWLPLSDAAGSPYRPRRWLPLSAAPLAPPIRRAAGSPYRPRRPLHPANVNVCEDFPSQTVIHGNPQCRLAANNVIHTNRLRFPHNIVIISKVDRGTAVLHTKQDNEDFTMNCDMDDMENQVEMEEKTRLINQVLELQHTLEDLSARVDAVKEENLKLKSENQVLGQYIENLMSASSVFQTTDNKSKRK
ncbi:uncharacterized protein LOC115182611 isoform X2 [Salmo trutta]|nr:uncharacterized protein LOC115182611 isoform X2 [Salmo trutta]